MKKFIAISGSLRKDSFNTRVLKVIQGFAPEGVEIELFDISTLPLYNQDLEASFPQTAQTLKDAIKNADGVIFATPEHNRSIPSALKNAIDWASRPWGHNSFAGKKVLVMGATGGALGTALAQSHLKQIMLYLDARVVGQPELYLGGIHEKIDEAGVITDESTMEHLQKALQVLKDY